MKTRNPKNNQSQQVVIAQPDAKHVSKLAVTKNSSLKKVFQFIREHIRHPETFVRPAKLTLTEEYWLEKRDPKHRNVEYLKKQHTIWLQTNQHLHMDLFSWLDQKTHANETPLSVKYLPLSTSLKKNKVHFVKGRACDIHHHPIDTSKCPGKGEYKGYVAYVMTQNGDLLIAEHMKGIFQHSSFISAAPVMNAGMIKIVNGKIVNMNNCSGHYKGNIPAMAHTIKRIPNEIFSKDCIIRFERQGMSITDLKKSDFIKYAMPMYAFFPILEDLRTKNIKELNYLIKQTQPLSTALTVDEISSLHEKINILVNKFETITHPSFDLVQSIKKGKEALTVLEIKLILFAASDEACDKTPSP